MDSRLTSKLLPLAAATFSLSLLAACCNSDEPTAAPAKIVGVDSAGNAFQADGPNQGRPPAKKLMAEPSISELSIATEGVSEADSLGELANDAVGQSLGEIELQAANKATVTAAEQATQTEPNTEPNDVDAKTVVANGTDSAVIKFVAKDDRTVDSSVANAATTANVEAAAKPQTATGTTVANGAAIVASAIEAAKALIPAKPTEVEERPVVTRTWMPIYDAGTANLVCDGILQKMQTAFDELAELPLADVSIDSVLLKWNTLSATFEDVEGPIYLQAYVSPNAAMRAAGEACIVRLGEFNTSLFQRQDLYQRVKATRATKKYDVTMRQDLLEAFDDNGIGLPADEQNRIKALKKQISELSQAFSRSVRENETKLTFSGDELAGLPDSYLERVGMENNSITVGFDYPEVFPFLNNASNEAARQRYLTAFSQRGTPKNLERLDEINQLRKELATIFGKPSYAHLVTQRRMVQNPETVLEFLGKVEKQVREVELGDLEELAALKAKLAGSDPETSKVQQWDKSYLKEKMRQQRYAIDQEALREHFPMPAVVDWGLWIASDLYGISFEAAKVPLWHEDVLYYDVLDTASGEFLGGIYLDLYPRDGKYKHAAAFGVRGGSQLENRRPNSVLVTNFDRKGLTHDELETFLHELGHVFHGVLTQTEYLAHSGTSVKRDFVEAPSQMFEEWARSPQTLKKIPDFCDGCPALNNETIERLNAARSFGRGIDYSRQHLYASFDMRLAGPNPEAALPTWYEMEGATPIGALSEGQFPGTFGHIAGGYAAGYYGYMWSEVLAIDMLSAFGDNLMDKAVGKRFRDIILGQGGQQEPMDLVTEFLNRKPSPEAFFKEITGQRK